MAYTVTIGRRNEDEEERKRRLQEANRKFIANNIKSSIAKSGAVDVSSGTPAVKTSVGQTTLPKASATTVGPKAWDKTATVTALPKAKPTANNSSRLVSALERASKASDLTPTARQMTRSNNFLKGVGTSLAATVPTLVDTTKQSLNDWQDKVKREGMASALSEMARNMDNPNWTYGNPVSTDSTGYRLYQKANDYFQKAQEGLNPAQQQAMGIAASIAQNAVTLPTAIINPAAPLVIMGAGAAANRANELTSQGKTATEALGRGLLSGALEVATEKIPLENLLSIAKTGGKSAVRNVLQQMGTEGAEELASYIMNYAADVSAGDPNANFSPSEAASSFLGGAISGGVMGGAASAVGNAPSYRQIQADNISYNNVLPGGNTNYSSDTSNVNVNVGNMNAGEYLDMIPRAREYASNAVNELTNAETPLALPRPTDFYSTPEGLTTERATDSWSTQPKTQTVIDNYDTAVFDSYDADRDVRAYKFIRDTAKERGISEESLYNAIAKKRDELYNSQVEGWVNTISNYKPQGVQTSLVEDPQTLGQYRRITQSNNERWYSELYKRFGHKPYKSQYKFAAEYLVDEGMRLADDGYSQEYIDPEVARQIRSLDHLLSGYDNITQGKRTDIMNIRDYGNGVYQVEYGTPREEFINDPTVFYQGRMAVETMPRAAEQQNGLTDNNVLSRPAEMENVSANNTDTYSTENTNIPQPKELDERAVLPTAEETERSADSLGIVNPEVQQLFEDINQMRENSRSVYQSAISGTAPFERMAKADTRENARNISALVNKYGQKGGITDTILTKGMFDINGNKIDNRSFVEVASQVPNEYKQLFNEYWDELHNIDRQAQGKPVTKHTADESRQRAAEIESQHPEFKKYKDDISDYLDKFMRAWGVDSGLISEEAYLAMKNMYPNYVPTYRVDGGGTGSGYVRSGKKLRGNTGIGRAKGSTAEVMSFDEAIAKKINTMIAAATKNDISREIFSFAQDLPAEAARSGIMIDTDTSGQYGGQMDLDEYIDSVDKNIARQISKGNYEITFYNNGKPQTMKISRDVWEAFNFLDNRLGGVKAFETFAKVGKTLTSPMRGLTTTYNPLFFMTNLIRDMQTYVINNTASNSAVALKNYVKAIKGIATNADTFEQYKALGGSQNGYYGSNIYSQAYERVNPSARSAGQKIADRIKILPRAIEAVGEFTEKIPRYAEFLNTIDRLGNTDAGRLQASLNAADVTVNFNRSSPLSTMANAWVPYFNAGLQGVDKTLRQIKAHPVKTGTRAAVSVFLPTLLLYLVNKDNPHWEDVKDGVRDSYYLIPNVFGPHDADGNAETFIRLPKSREFGALFSASFERFIRAFEESEDEDKSLKETLPKAFEGYTDTLLNSVSPPDILGDNILGSVRRLGTNTAWHGGKIVPSNLENVSPEFQYDINTSGLAMGIAEKAQKIPGAPDWLKSPMKVDYLIDSYGGYGADLIQGLTSRKNQGATTGETLANSVYTGVIQPFINRFTTDSAYSNYNLDRFYDELDVLETAANDRNLRENLPSDYRTPEEKVESDFTKARNDISDITKQERAVLESAIPIREKNAQIRALKQQKNAIAKEMLQNEDALYSQYEDLYIPVISGLTDSRQEAARQLNKEYGLTYDEYADLYAKYSEINKEDIKPRMKATKFEEYLNSLGYTDQYKITPVLKDEFSYFTASPATSYYDSKSYQLVDGILPVETYADLSSLVYGLESGVDYPKGEKSPFAKSLIDAYLEKYGYNPTANERAKIYDAMGVAKSYWY